jgi:putative transposase
MSTYTQLIYQIVFRTKGRDRSLTSDNRPKLFNYMVGILNTQKCHPYIINGVEDHIHIITHIHPDVAISRLMKDIKMACTDYIKREQLFKNFRGWQEGYGAFTYSITARDTLIEYVKNQEKHHKTCDFENEYRKLLKEHDVDFDERYLL